MTTETATLLAVMAAPLAVLVLIAAAAVIVGARRTRRVLAHASDRLDVTTGQLGRELRTGQETLDRVRIQSGGVRGGSRARDEDIRAWTTALEQARATIERLDQRRVAPAVRAMRWAGALGRVALMWRTPGR